MIALLLCLIWTSALLVGLYIERKHAAVAPRLPEGKDK